MAPILGRGNVEMTRLITNRGGHMAEMWENRNNNLVTLYRVCQPPEAVNTWFYCLAGGEYHNLDSNRASEEDTVEQVGNHEGVPWKTNRSKEIEKLRSMGIKVGTSTKKRVVVEYSLKPARQFEGTVIIVRINRQFLTKGSNLSFEGGGGYCAQVGTPLSCVQIDDDLLQGTGPTFYPVLNEVI